MSRNVAIAAVLVVLVILVGWYFIKSQTGGISYTQPAPVASPKVSQPTSPATPSATKTTKKNIVTIQSSGFLPKNITIKTEESVTWVNQDTADHTVNSTPHPIHTDYSSLNLGVIKPGESKSLTFPKVGTYKYHNHLNPSLTGSVTVE